MEDELHCALHWMATYVTYLKSQPESIFYTHLKRSLKHCAPPMHYITAHDFINSVLLPILIYGHVIELVSIAIWDS